MVTSGDVTYLRPLPCAPVRSGMRRIGGTGPAFAEIELSRRAGPTEILPADAIPALVEDGAAALDRLTQPRRWVDGRVIDRPKIMGVVNVTPDSFSDGGRFGSADNAIAHGLALANAGADVLDIGGESTRPGAEQVPEDAERVRVLPVIEGLIAAGCTVPISIDTRKAAIARDAIAAGARLFNDVSALQYDEGSPAVARDAQAVCLMHAQGDPRTMQDAPSYDDVVKDVYDFLAARIAAAERAGIDRARIWIDPGIGFGKTLAHNLQILRHLSLFHALGCVLLLGVSRKGFIGALTGEAVAARRVPGSLAAGLMGLGQGVQILRVHDVAETCQALDVWDALRGSDA